MLVLARKLDEVICIGDKIRIKVVEFRPGIVKLGIEAPDDVVIMRKELLPESKFDLRAKQDRFGNKQHDNAR